MTSQRSSHRPERASLAANGLGAYVGLANGFVLSFSTGLKVYLSGDTGLTAEMDSVVSAFYQPSLAAFNISTPLSRAPRKPPLPSENSSRRAAPSPPSHANEAATTGGRVNPGTRTALLIDLLQDIPVYVPRSGMTMQFGRDGKCVNGCN